MLRTPSLASWRFIFLAVPFLIFTAVQARTIDCDVCVVGGGSGGFGAALSAARAGANVVLVEKLDRIGGTSTAGFVSNWEPGPGCSFARELYDRLAKEEHAVAVAPRTHNYTPEEPYGLCLGDPRYSYDDSLRRAGVPLDRQCSVVMKPEALAAAMEALLREAGVQILLNTAFQRVELSDGLIRHITCSSNTGETTLIQATVFIDATGDVTLCREAGCEVMLGEEGRDKFNEPSAPDTPRRFLNAISLCYRIVKTDTPAPPVPPAASEERFGKSAFIYGIHDRELIVNTLALTPGMDLVDKGYDEMLAASRKRAAAHWAWLWTLPAFQGYTLEDVAPMPGIRESYRVVTDYILTEQDVRAGLASQTHHDMIAVADHALDIHGGGHGTKELGGPYGIPYRCLLPRNTKNLLVACRGAGFSHIAASSCRLSRTMIALGHAAGIAAAEAAAKDGGVRAVDGAGLARALEF
ncbi:MAG: FAD-dependent oxidoreductase [Candidatus Hydrogenedentes bacterium]|nr:FAD-dependent oxidoreductase [Candidatus Hydrogenedentota bacterium]